MELKEGFSYHIKNEFFEKINEIKFMKNKEGNNYRPHYYAICDPLNRDILWMIPISSKYEKYKKIAKNKEIKYGKCDTIVLGNFSGKKCAFLLQNAFPIKRKFIDHIHTKDGMPVIVHNELHKTIRIKIKKMIALKKSNINLFYINIDKILNLLCD